MRVNVGDRVIIRADIQNGESYRDNYGRGLCAGNSVRQYAGQTATVTHIDANDGTFRIDIDGGYWWWNDGMVETIEDHVFKIGDKIVIRRDLHRSSTDYFVNVNSEMCENRGRIATITEKISYRGRMVYKIDLDTFTYTTEMFKLYKEGEEEDMNELTTLMDKSVTWERDEKLMKRLYEQSEKLLTQYHYAPEKEGLDAVLNKWVEKKGWMIKLFEKHPFYDGYFKIIIPARLKRPVDTEKIHEFRRWAVNNYTYALRDKIIKVGMFDLYEYMEARDRVSNILRKLNSRMTYNGFGYNYWESEYKRMCAKIDEVERKLRETTGSSNWECIEVDGKYSCVPYVDYKNKNRFADLLETLFDNIKRRENPHLIPKPIAEYVNTRLTEMKLKTRAAEGQKVSKFIGKLLTEIGLNKVVKMETQSWRDENGNYHERERDMGYNYYFAMLGDSVNPIEYDRDVVISCNPIDYWTMSFGWKWTSCHTIDKLGERPMSNSDDDHNYSGMYSGGTESYMLDDCSLIVYVRPTEKQLEDYNEDKLPIEEQSKYKRCVFMLGEDKIMQGRVYPDGRDGGDDGLCGQLREIMQRIVSELLDTSNMWTLKKGSSECRKISREGDGYCHYRDYVEYGDGTVSYLRRVNGYLNENRITVGTYSICPKCGKKHDDHNHITCEDCFENNERIGVCSECDDIITENELNHGVAIRARDGRLFCCSDCARNAGYVWAVDEDQWIDEDYCNFDNWEEEWYYEDSYGVSTVDDTWYHDEDTAHRAGYYYADWDDNWALEDDIREIGNTGEYFITTQHYNYICTADGKCFPDEDEAENAGYAINENGTWELVA